MGKLKTGAYAAVFVLALVGLGISSTRLLDISAEYQRSNIAYRQLREIKGIKGPREVVEDKLKDINPDYIAWLQIENTPIDYPVVMESDRDYLITGFYGENSIAGTPFIRRTQNAFQDKNTVIFGHNMRDGTMFAALKNYLKSEYCKQYPTITILNKGREYKYKIFSVQLLNEDDGSVFAYTFANDESYREYLDLMIQKSLVQLTEQPDTDRNIITLSTCYGKDKRLVVQAFGEG